MTEWVPVSSFTRWVGLEGSEAALRGLEFAERHGADLTEACVIVENNRIRAIGGWPLDSSEEECHH